MEKTVGTLIQTEIFSEQVIRLKDGNYLATGYTTTATFNLFIRLWLIKFDVSGSIIYSKYIAVPGGSGIRASGICETSDGGFAITGSKSTAPNTSESILMRLNSNSDVLWIVSSDNPYLNSGKSFSSVIEHQWPKSYCFRFYFRSGRGEGRLTDEI